MNVIKSGYKDILLVLGYILVAELVYVSLAIIFLKQWYFGLLAGFVVFLIGAVIGFFYVKSEYKERIKKEESKKVADQATN